MVLSLWWFKESALDTGFHLAYGRHFLDTGEIVTFDPFLDPAIVRPFINGNWGTQVIMAAAERSWGVTGLIVMRWVLLSIVFGVMAVIVRREARGWHWLAWAWMLAAVTAYERFSLRPELFGYVILTLMLAILLRGPVGWRGIVALGVLQVAWTNISFYYLVGLLLTACFLAGAWINRGAPRPGCEPAVQPTPARRLGLALAVQSAACFVNPWHIRGVLFPFQTLRFLQDQKVVGLNADQSDGGSWSHISEFRHSFGFLGELANRRTIDAYYVLLAVAIVALIALFARRRWGEAIAVTLFMVMSVQMRRNIAQFALVAAPLAACAFATAVPTAWIRVASVMWLRRALVLATIVAAVAWTWSIVDGRFYFVERRINREPGMGYSERVFPIDAVQWLSAQAAIGPRLYVDMFTSSNALPWLDRRFRPMVNTNTFVYDDQWLRKIMDVAAGRMGHRPFFRQQDVDAVLLHIAPDTEPLVRALRGDEADWALVYADPHMVIFVRRKPEHEAIIKANQPQAEDVDVDDWINTTGGLRYHRALSLATKAAAPWALGWYGPAARLFEEALRLAPDSPPTWNYLGLCYGKLAEAAVREGRTETAQGQLRRAISCFEQVVSMQPDNEVLKNNLARARDMLQSLN